MLPALLISFLCFSPEAASGQWISAKSPVRYVWETPQGGHSDRLLTGELPARDTTDTIPQFTGELPTIDFRDDPYPFPEGTIRPEDFSVSVGETSPTLALGGGEFTIPLTVRHVGKGVVWQPHPTLADFLVVECVEGRERADAVTQKSPGVSGRTVAERMQRSQMSFVPSPWASAVVFCGNDIHPEAVRQEYIDRWLHPGPLTNVPEEDFRAFAETFVDMAKEFAARSDFVGNTWQARVVLGDYWKPRIAGQYAFRIGIYIYPNITAKNWNVPLSERTLVWSAPFAVEVK